jgi:hypothetical protein
MEISKWSLKFHSKVVKIIQGTKVIKDKEEIMLKNKIKMMITYSTDGISNEYIYLISMKK